MKTKKDPGLHLKAEIATCKKTSYQAPMLRVYGAVTQLTAGGTGTVADTSSISTNPNRMNPQSDRAVKENIVRVGTHPLGIGLYLFHYKPEFRELSGFGRRFGVMADEVETVMPEAVVTHPDGYKRVNYAMLGIDLSVRSVH